MNDKEDKQMIGENDKEEKQLVDEKVWGEKLAELALQLESKYELYMVTLSFAIVGLSIQTAEFTGCFIPDVCEVAGWAFLTLSGIYSLSVINSLIGLLFNVFQSPRPLIERRIISKKQEEELRDIIKFRFSRLMLFFVGIICLIIARCFVPISSFLYEQAPWLPAPV